MAAGVAAEGALLTLAADGSVGVVADFTEAIITLVAYTVEVRVEGVAFDTS